MTQGAASSSTENPAHLLESVFELRGARTGNCFRAAIGLCEAGVPFRVHRINFKSGEHRDAEHLALNPAGKVPVLVRRQADGSPDFVLTQSNAILMFAANWAPGLLVPHDSGARAKALEAYFYFVTDVIALNGIGFTLKGEGFLEASQKLIDRHLTRIAEGERFLSSAGFMGSEQFSVADIAAFTIAQAVSEQLPWDRLPRLADWRERVATRPGVQAGLSAFDPETDH